MNQKEDRALHITLADGYVRGLFISARHTVEKARDIHHTTPVVTAALGRALIGTAMLSSTLKEEGASVTVTLAGDGPIGRIVCVGDRLSVRGAVDVPDVRLPLKENGKLDVGGAVGHNGRMSVVKDLRLKAPYVGQIQLVSGEIAEDFADYLARSEQSPSLVSLGVLTREEEVVSAGGVLLQPLPGCPDSVISELELRSPLFGDLSHELSHEPIEALMQSWLNGLRPVVLETTPLGYECRCSRERMEKVLLALGRAELEKLIAEEKDGAELCCHFCGRKERFSTQEMRGLLDHAAQE
ncbi:MAG: Hsp33 family molecular chaperone HslO [Eubacteriales bacterium]|nr:Hsp33 family molecular chaperone HslO [Eubacteriales bacterium]